MLILSLAALLAGPAAFGLARTHPRLLALLDVAITASIALLVAAELWPLMLGGSAGATLFAAAIGLYGPTAVESVLHRVDYHRIEARAHLVTMIVGLAGLGLHAFVDGAALTESGASPRGYLAGAVVAHRVPVGLAIWWLVRPTFGASVAWILLAAVAASTVVGFSAGTRILPALSPSGLAAFQGFVGGSLLHVVFFRKHIEAHRHAPTHD